MRTKRTGTNTSNTGPRSGAEPVCVEGSPRRQLRCADFFYLAEEDGSIRGVLPTYAIRDLLGEDRIHTPKFALVADSADVADELLSHLSAFCEENSMVSSLVHAGYTTQATASPDRVATNLVMELARDEETQWWSLIGSPRGASVAEQAPRWMAEVGREAGDAGPFHQR